MIYKWSEMSVAQKIFFVLGWVSAVLWLVLVILKEASVIETNAVLDVLKALWCFGHGYVYKNRGFRVAWFVVAGLNLALCYMHLF